MPELLVATKKFEAQDTSVAEVPTTSDIILISEDSATSVLEKPIENPVILDESAERQHKALVEEIRTVVSHLAHRNSQESLEVADRQALALGFIRTVEAYTVELTDREEVKDIWRTVVNTLSESDSSLTEQDPYSRIFVEAYNKRQKQKEALSEIALKNQIDFKAIRTPSAEELEEVITHVTPETVSPPRGIRIREIAKRALSKILLDEKTLDK